MLRYYITDRDSAGGIAPLLLHIERAVADGVDLIQIREKNLCARDLFQLAVKALELARGSRTRVLVNSRVDIALAAGADGVHLPGNSISPGILRSILPPGFLIGVSTHSPSEIETAQSEMADFAVFGPVFPPRSKISFSPAVGIAGLRDAVRKASIPVFALGGITPENIGLCMDAGAAGVAAISLFQSPGAM